MFWLRLIFLISSVFACGDNLTPTRKKYNVLLVVFDDLRPAIFGYGDQQAHTPNIDRFMQRSSYFTRAYSQQALCAPSRNSMLTGRRPDTLRLYDFYSYWRNVVGNYSTLPQYFKEHGGYQTYSIGKVFHPGLSSNYCDDYPFSWSYPPFHPPTESFMNSPVCPDGSGKLHANLVCPVRVTAQPKQTLPDIESVQQAKKFLQARNNCSAPYFLAVGIHKPHIPFKFPEKFLKFFPKNDFNYTVADYKPYGMPNVAWNPFTDIRSRDDVMKLNVSFPFGPIPKDYRSKIRNAYYASVSYVDYLFGKLLTYVNMDDTIVVLTSDHGWSLGEHGEWAKYSNFEVSVRVPLIIYSPEFNITSPQKYTEIVELVDLFPTMIDLAKLHQIPRCQDRNQTLCTEGKSLYHSLKCSKPYNEGIAFSQYPRPSAYPSQHPNSDKPLLKQIQIMGYSVRTTDFRYTLWIGFNPKTFERDWTKIYGEELYDHRIDPQENMNLVDREGFEEIRSRLTTLLKAQFTN